MVLIITNNKVCAIVVFIYFFEFCKRLCVSGLDLFSTFVVKIISFQKKHLRETRVHLFFKQRCFLAKLKF